MKNVLLGTGLALGLCLAPAATAEDPPVKDMQVTIQGCVVEADHDSFVLTHVRKVSEQGVPAAAPMLGKAGMENAEGELIYWLSKDSIKKMRGHLGHRVEVMGKVTDVSTGTVEIEKEPGKRGADNTVEVDARGKDAKAETDRPVEPGPAPAPGSKVEKKKTLPVHRIDVDTVRMVSATCP